MTTTAVPPPLPMKHIEDRVPIDHAKLRALREEKQLSFGAMSDACGGVENTYRAIEAGKRDPKLSQVLGILRVLGLTSSDLPRLLRDDEVF